MLDSVPLDEGTQIDVADAQAASDGWVLEGTCEYRLDSNGTMTIRPAQGEIVGELYAYCWEQALQTPIKRLIFEGNLVALPVHDLPFTFTGLNKLQSIEGLSNIDTSVLDDMSYLFYECESLTNLDLTGWDTSNVKDMSYMFSGCTNLESVNLESFDTSKVENMALMFDRCSSLRSLDLSNFQTPSLKYMSSMFQGCFSLKDIDLTSFDTSNATEMVRLFYGCRALESVDLHNFDTSKIDLMFMMFEECRSLKSLDLSSFDTSNTIRMETMFYGCTALEKLDISSFDTRQVFDGQHAGLETLSSLTEFSIGPNFTLHEYMPEKNWYDRSGAVYTPKTLPRNTAGTYTSYASHVIIKVPEGGSTSLELGSSLQLTAEIAPPSLAPSLVWSSSNEGIVSVDNAGMVSALAVGEAVITARAGDLNDSVSISVRLPDVPIVEVQSVSLDSDHLSLSGIASETLSATVLPANATYKNVVWSSSDESVARVSAQGSVTPTGKGSATITARSADGKRSATCVVTVSNPVTWAGISATPTKVYVSKSYDVSLSSRGDLPGETDGFTSVAWSSSDGSIASVSGSGTAGTITGVAPGSCTLQVSAVRDGKTFDISEPIQVEWDLIEKITLSEANKSVEVGSPSFTLNYAISNPSAAGRLGEVKWSSISIAEVKGSDGTLTITPKRAGHEVIRFWGPGHSAQASFELTITPKVVEATEDSDVEGYMHINDSEAVDLIGNKRLRILESEDKLEPDVVKLAVSSAGDASFMVDAYDIDLVDDAGNVVPWDEPDHALSVFTKMNDPMKQLITTHDLGVHYVDAQSNKAEAKSTWVEGENLAFETTHFSTYAITATERPVEVTQPPLKNDTNTGSLAQTGDGMGAVVLVLFTAAAASTAGVILVRRRMRKVL